MARPLCEQQALQKPSQDGPTEGQAATGCPRGKQHAAAGQVQTLGTKGGFLKRPD